MTAASLIPYTTAQRATGQKGVGSFYVKASSAGTVSLDMNTVEAYLLQATRDEDAYSVSNQSQVLDTMDEVDNTMSLLLGGIAAISLLVGGIGIMNIHGWCPLQSAPGRSASARPWVPSGGTSCSNSSASPASCPCWGGAVGLALSFGVVAFYNLAAGSSASLNWANRRGSHPVLRGHRHPVRQLPAAKASRLQPIEAPAHPVNHRKTAKPWGAPQGFSLFIILPGSGSCPPPGPGR